jgi:assimilatory nitrate reductase catalytic subunit
MAAPTPLWPAGHLPLKGGDWLSLPSSPIINVAKLTPASKLPISSLEGEMAGRPEGGPFSLLEEFAWIST